MSHRIEDIQRDIAAFADDDNEVLIEARGDIIFTRGGEDTTCRLLPDADGSLHVEVEGQRMTYRRFLSHFLGRLDVFAEKLLSKRQIDAPFVNSPASLESVSSATTEGLAIDLLGDQCSQPPLFASRVLFVTADAGQGKTILLREFQEMQAKAFLRNEAPCLFWHVDLQGRQLLRLHEALMGDLGDLRMTGLFMPSIVTLLRHRCLVLAIDGFDELAAEQGSVDALSALAHLVRELEDSGTIVAASRRTFFDTEDYLARSRLLRRSVSGQCEFDQMHLLDWSKHQVCEYLAKFSIERKSFDDPESVYTSMLAEVNGDATHPMLTRPFLVAHAAKAMLRYDMKPADLLAGAQDAMESVQAIVDAFIKREVHEKWRTREGTPYLTQQQHTRLLTAVAEEMWRLQKDRLPVDALEEIALLLLEGWDVEDKRQVLDMVKMHVLLPYPADGDGRFRAFDHPEFQNYFVAWSLKELLEESCTSSNATSLGRFLAIAQLPEAVARYASLLLENRREAVPQILEILQRLVASERRPTFLQSNVGTLVPFLLHRLDNKDEMQFAAHVAYTGLAFENTNLKAVSFVDGQVSNASLCRVSWKNVRFVNCQFSDVTFDMNARYEHVTFQDCDVASVIVVQDGEETSREYSPIRVQQLLQSLGIRVVEGAEEVAQVEQPGGELRKIVQKILRNYRRATALTENVIQLKFGQDAKRVIEEVIPLMDKHGLIREDKWKGGGKPQKRWLLTQSAEQIQAADGEGEGGPLTQFWEEVNQQ